MKDRLLGKYKNGNYTVSIFSDGTKIRYNNLDNFQPEYPETLDVNISNYCENNCEFCYISASTQGKHGNLNLDVFNQLKPFTEIAINFAKHPQLEEFLIRMKDRKVIVNMTINQRDVREQKQRLDYWIENKLIYGLGISVVNISKDFIEENKRIFGNNIVYHTITAITTKETFKTLESEKVLVLGFKQKGRGTNLGINNYSETESVISEAIKNKSYQVLSFDNLALEQLHIQDKIDKGIWENYYMGEEGQFSMYIDTVEEKYYKSSLELIGYPIENKNIKEMFEDVKN